MRGAAKGGQQDAVALGCVDVRVVPVVGGADVDRQRDIPQAHRHRHRFGDVQRTLRMEEPVRIAFYDTGLLGVAYVLAEPVRRPNIWEAVVPVGFRRDWFAPRMTEQNDLQKLRTVEQALGTERPVGISFDRTDIRQQADTRGFRRIERRIGVAAAHLTVIESEGSEGKDEEEGCREEFAHTSTITYENRCRYCGFGKNCGICNRRKPLPDFVMQIHTLPVAP